MEPEEPRQLLPHPSGNHRIDEPIYILSEQRSPLGESAKVWMAALTELRNPGVAGVFFGRCDGLKGLPDSVNAVWPMATVRVCITHLTRGTFRYAARKYWDECPRTAPDLHHS